MSRRSESERERERERERGNGNETYDVDDERKTRTAEIRGNAQCTGSKLRQLLEGMKLP